MTTKEYYARQFPEFETLGINQSYKSLYEELIYDVKHILPQQSYVGNCTKEFTSKLVSLYGEQEFKRIQQISFPCTRENPITDTQVERELQKLLFETMPKKNTSVIVQRYHPSINLANRQGCLSPVEGWRTIQQSKEKFIRFYSNRLRCSDWFKEKDNVKYLVQGHVPEFIYGIGLSTSRMYPQVSYFKPSLAKYIVEKYLDGYGYKTVFDPFSGYCGRMLGSLAAGMNYVGQDLCRGSINENRIIFDNVWKPFAQKHQINNHCTTLLTVADSVQTTGQYDCLFTCPPYMSLEQWPDVDLQNRTCDEWIDICLQNYKCKRYVFVVDDNISKYKNNIVETLDNVSHFGKNHEYVIVIDNE